MAWEKIIKKDADVNDTIQLIVDTINKYSESEYVQRITSTLQKQSSSSLNKFLHNLFNYVCTQVKYQLDPVNHERVTTPERLIKDGIGDCKKMSVFIASVLKCAGITPLLKVISYDGENYEHIYVIVQNDNGTYTTLDPVNNCRYNEEIPHVKARVLDLKNKEMPQLSLLGKPPIGKPVRQVHRPVKTWYRESGSFQPLNNSRFLNYLHGPEVILPTNSRFLNYLNGAVSSIDRDLTAIATSPKDEQEFLISQVAQFMVQQKKKGNKRVSGVFSEWWDEIKTAVGGVGDSFHDTVANPQTWQTLLDGLKDVGGQILDALKTLGLGPARGAFLLLLDVNFLGLADKLYNAWIGIGTPSIVHPAMKNAFGQVIPGSGYTTPATHPNADRIKNWWSQLGGDVSILRNSVAKGVGKNSGTLSGLGLDPATITAASALVISITKLLSDLGVLPSADKAQIDKTILAALKTSATQNTPGGTKQYTDSGITELTDPNTGLPINNTSNAGISGIATFLLVGVGATLLYKAVKK